MKSIIKCGNISIYIVFPIIGGIFKFIAEYFVFKSDSEINEYPFILGLNAGLGLSLSLFPYLFEKIRSKRINKKNSLFDTKIISNNPYLEKFNKIKHFKYLLILLSSFSDFFQKLLYFYYRKDIENNFWMFDIFFINL